MTIPSESFKLVTPSLAVNMYVVDWPLVDESIVKPQAVNSLLLGEWLTVTKTEGKAEREDAAGGRLSFPFFSPKGAYDIQFRKIVPLIQHGTFVADTWVFDRSAPGLALGANLTAKLITFEGADRSILTTYAGAEMRRAIVLRMPSNSTAPLRILGNY